MKFRAFTLFFLGLSMVAVLTGCGAKGNASTEFWVRGNCEMCKATIEGAAQATPGVMAASYDLEAHTLHVDYDSTQVNKSQLHAACAAVGYETKTQPATAEAYAELPSCCKKPADQ